VKRAALLLTIPVMMAPALALERAPTGDATQNYTLFCAGCHGEDGRGLAHRIPRLAGRLGLYLGIDGGRDFLLRVPGVANSQLDPERLAAVLNLAVQRFAPERNGKDAPFTAEEIARARRRPLVHVETERTQLLRAAGVTEQDIAAEY
jgi:hypothetical protein